jgi:hypothetical protein
MKPVRWYIIGLLATLVAAIGTAALYLAATPTPTNQIAAETERFPLIPGDLLGALDARQRLALMKWLVANPAYQPVRRDYCQCADGGKYPYLSIDDFNADGHSDVAALLAMTGGAGEPMVLFIFNGPFDGSLPKPAFSATHWRRNDALFGNFIGPTESDDGYVIASENGKYELEYQGDGG